MDVSKQRSHLPPKTISIISAHAFWWTWVSCEVATCTSDPSSKTPCPIGERLQEAWGGPC
jgi:hypothetical protein